MTVDRWYSLRSAATAYRTTGQRTRLAGTVRNARSAGVSWPVIAAATGVSVSTLRRLVLSY